MKKIKMSLLAMAVLSASTLSAEALNFEKNYTIADEMKIDGQVRLNFESNDVKDNASKKATALTNRLLINTYWSPSKLKNTTVKASFLNVSSLVDNYNISNDTSPKYDSIDNPTQTRVSELNMTVNYPKQDTSLTIGRQTLELADGRFISNADENQMYRSFDSIYIQNETVEDLKLSAFYSTKTLTETEATSKNDIAFINLDYTMLDDMVNVSLFDIMAEDVNDVVGTKIGVKTGVRGAEVNVTGQLAYQMDATLGNSDVSGDKFYELGANVSYQNVTVGMDYTVQEEGFVNTYGNKTNFNGFANAVTGDNLETFKTYVGYKTPKMGNFKVAYLDFNEEKNGTDLGTEIDLSWDYDIAKNLNVMAKGGIYDKDNATTMDTSRYMVQLDYRF